MHYPIGRLSDELGFVLERENGRAIMDAQLIQLIVTGLLSPKARKQFTKQVNSLNVASKPIAGLFDYND